MKQLAPASIDTTQIAEPDTGDRFGRPRRSPNLATLSV